MKKLKNGRYEISLRCYIRNYTYTATLNAKGTLLRINAGCRTWPNFAEAQKHYRGETFRGSQWTDTAIGVNTHTFDRRLWAMRWEARAILALLQNHVANAQVKIRAKNRRAKK